MLDDPFSLLLWSSLIIATSIYPVGLLFGSCSECCGGGGWYCCNTAPSNVFCGLGAFLRVSVTVTAPDYFKRVSEQWNIPCTDFGIVRGFIAQRRTTYTFGSHLNGTFVLSGTSTQLSHTYTNTDRIGCTGHYLNVQLARETRLTNGREVNVLLVYPPVIAHRVFEHTKVQAGPPPVSSAGEGDMTCNATITNPYPCGPAFPNYSPRVVTSSLLYGASYNFDQNDTEPFGRIALFGPCFSGTTVTKNYSIAFDHPVHVGSSDEKGPIGNFAIISEEGSLSGSVSMTVEFL